MGTTPLYSLPYPELDDSANVPRDVKALAEAVEGITPVWCDLQANAVQSLTSGTTTNINLNTGTQEPAGQWASGALVKIVAAGLYQVVLVGSFTGTSAIGSRLVTLRVNGVDARTWGVPVTAGNGNASGSFTVVRRFALNDNLNLAQYQNSGTTLTTASQFYPTVSLLRLGP